MPKLRVIIKPPPEPSGDTERDVEAQRDYLLQMSEELAYVLTHLESDNIDDSTFERIQGMIPRPYTGLPVMDGEANPGSSAQWSRGDHRHPTDNSRAPTDHAAASDIYGVGDKDNYGHLKLSGAVASTSGATQGVAATPSAVKTVHDIAIHTQNDFWVHARDFNNPHVVTAAQVGAIPVTEKGSAGGVAELDSNGMVPSAQLPSYVDDVLEYPAQADFPVTGENGKIYVALDSNRTYRWSGSAYVEISESLALGETSSTAYRGDWGKIAYDHSQTVGNPHGTTAADVGARPNDWMPSAADVGARPDTWTPTASDVGARPDTWTPSAADVGARPDDWVPDAEDVPYDPTQSGLTATDMQDAIDEVYGDIPVQASDIGAQDEITASGILKGDGAGGVSAATPGTDYTKPTTYPSATITVTDPTYATSASIDGIIRQDNFCTLAITIVLAGQIPTTRTNVAQVHGIPRTVNNVTGIMQVTNYLFAVQLQPGGVVNLMAIGQAQGGSGWTGRVQIPYITDGTLTA